MEYLVRVSGIALGTKSQALLVYMYESVPDIPYDTLSASLILRLNCRELEIQTQFAILEIKTGLKV